MNNEIGDGIMNRRKRKKIRKRLYQECIEDVALEISLDACWRKDLWGRHIMRK